MPIESTDRDLALRAKAGDPIAFGALVERHQVSVFHVCYRLLGERRAAEDLAQETFIRAYQRLNTFDPALPFGPWVRRVAANVCLNALDRKRPVLFSLDEDRAEIESVARVNDPAVIHDHTETVDAVRNAVLSLPPHYRVVIELCHMQDMSYAEAADTLNIPLSDIKSHLFRARKLLAIRLQQMRPAPQPKPKASHTHE